MQLEELLDAADHLSQPEFERLVHGLLLQRTKRTIPVFQSKETQLLLEINQGIPIEINQRYQVLREKRDDETLTDNEYEELIHLGDRIEIVGANRIAALAKLADLTH